MSQIDIDKLAERAFHAHFVITVFHSDGVEPISFPDYKEQPDHVKAAWTAVIRAILKEIK
jgi:hypothetical protein